MQFTLSSGALNSRLQTLARVINSKNTLSILDCFLFEVANNVLTVTASDSENVMQSTIELAECSGDGKFALSNRTILNAVKELPEQPLSFNVDENDFSVVSPNHTLHRVQGLLHIGAAMVAAHPLDPITTYLKSLG